MGEATPWSEAYIASWRAHAHGRLGAHHQPGASENCDTCRWLATLAAAQQQVAALREALGTMLGAYVVARRGQGWAHDVIDSMPAVAEARAALAATPAAPAEESKPCGS